MATLEGGSSATKVKPTRPQVNDLWRKGRNSLLLVLVVCLAWFTCDNATSITQDQQPAVAAVAPTTPFPAAVVAPEPAPPPATAVIREEPIATHAASVKPPALAIPAEAAVAAQAAAAVTAQLGAALASPTAAPLSASPQAERIAAIDKAKPPVRPTPAKKAPRPAPATGPEAAPPDSDVAILSAIVAQGHAAKAASGR